MKITSAIIFFLNLSISFADHFDVYKNCDEFGKVCLSVTQLDYVLGEDTKIEVDYEYKLWRRNSDEITIGIVPYRVDPNRYPSVVDNQQVAGDKESSVTFDINDFQDIIPDSNRVHIYVFKNGKAILDPRLTFKFLSAPNVNPTRSPVKPTRSPVRPTRSPRKPTRSPRKPTRSPRKPTRSPVRPTRSPVEPTRSPVEPTRSPVEPTRSPHSTSVQKCLNLNEWLCLSVNQLRYELGEDTKIEVDYIYKRKRGDGDEITIGIVPYRVKPNRYPSVVDNQQVAGDSESSVTFDIADFQDIIPDSNRVNIYMFKNGKFISRKLKLTIEIL